MLLDTVKQNYDYILLDCMPSLGMLTVNALAAADNVLIPVQAAYLPAKGLEQLLETINKVRRQINPKLKIEGILLTMVDSRTNYSKDISNLRHAERQATAGTDHTPAHFVIVKSEQYYTIACAATMPWHRSGRVPRAGNGILRSLSGRR